ncbi:MAG: hypothetical protein DME90_06245 [Verrucomicrobia bacterium]|nr:MAG: hypothetical protein DME90_06245 [Verrucomicrobiota bacterium]
MNSSGALHLNLDDAWRNEPPGLAVVDARKWGPQLRFSAPPRLIEKFYREHEANLAVPFLLYGAPAEMGMRWLDQSRTGTSANQACGSLGLRQFRMLVATSNFWESSR